MGAIYKRKRARLIVEGNTVPPLPIPTETPPLGRTEITVENYAECFSTLPNISPGELYRYMALGVGYWGSATKAAVAGFELSYGGINSGHPEEFKVLLSTCKTHVFVLCMEEYSHQ